MTIKTLKERVARAIDEHSEQILEASRKIFSQPELGYKEHHTTQIAIDLFESLGLEVESPIAVTGCRTVLNPHQSGPSVAILAELDAIMVHEHPLADPSGVVHACGHNIQMGGLFGAVIALVVSGVLEHLDGRVVVMTTPAEEFVELEYRQQLREAGEIEFFGGKQELIKRGYFEDIDISMMFHALDLGEKAALVGPVSNGFIGKKVRYIGKSSHAGSAPEEGINALNAATLGMMNIQAQRETFKDRDRVRVHPIITKGGDIVNVIPSDVRMEAYVRARTIEGMIDANEKVNRALKAGAYAVGADIEITEIPGYLPILRTDSLDELFKQNVEALGFAGEVIDGGDFTGSFDFGDLSHLMPALHPMIGGVRGALHTKEFAVIDEQKAILMPAKAMAFTIIDLLFDHAAQAEAILESFTPLMNRESYLQFMQQISKTISERHMS